MDSDQHSKDPSLSASFRNNPFTGELKAMLDDLRNTQLEEIEDDDPEAEYSMRILHFFRDAQEIGITPQESVGFWRFVRLLNSYEEPDYRTELFRKTLLEHALGSYYLFFQQKSSREQVASIIVKILSENDVAFRFAMFLATSSSGIDYRNRNDITPPGDEQTREAVAHAHFGSLVYEASMLRGLA
jgi:hypothetical protein